MTSAHPTSSSPTTTSRSLPPTQPQRSEFGTLTLEHTLEDLAARFIVNLPAEELESMDRVCFQIEQAHWYYEDFVRPSALNPALLPSYTLKQFLLLMFQACPLLHDLVPNHQRIWTSFMAYKERVPVCGAVLISEFWDKVLLVKGWQKGASWSFPRGKINKEEAEGMCAVREVLEETGFDLTGFFPRDQLAYGNVEEENAERRPYYVELVIKEQKIRLYFIAGIHEDTYFETRTRKEISKIDWFDLSDLPTWGKDRKGKKDVATASTSQKQAKFYMVTPFTSHLKLWIDRNKPRDLRKRQTNRRQNVRRPRAPTPLTSHKHDGFHRDLPAHLQSSDVDDTLAESDLDADPSSSSPSSEEDGIDEGVRRHAEFLSTEEGTLALNAFFFGGEPSNCPAPASPTQHRPLEPLQELVKDSDSPGQTPPQMAYKRQTSFVQPRPKATPQHTNKLLALLTNNNPVASPPPQKTSRRSSRHESRGGSGTSTGPQEGGDLRASFDQILASRSTAYLGRSPSIDPSDASSSPAQSILFANSAPPVEAVGFGETHVLTAAERSENERNEKREAAMRALYSVLSLPMPEVDPREAESPVLPPLKFSHVGSQTTMEAALDDLRRSSGLAPFDELQDPPACDFSTAPSRKLTGSHSSKLLALLTNNNLSPSADLSDSSSSPAQSVLFADSSPPEEAIVFREAHALTEAERSENERNEKREAAMRALYSVLSLPPPHVESPLVPSNIASLFKGPRRAESPALPPLDFSQAAWGGSPTSPTLDAALDDLRRAAGLAPFDQLPNPFEEPELQDPPAFEFTSAPSQNSTGSSGSSSRHCRQQPEISTQSDSQTLLAMLRGNGGGVSHVSDGERRQLPPPPPPAPNYSSGFANQPSQTFPPFPIYYQPQTAPQFPHPSSFPPTVPPSYANPNYQAVGADYLHQQRFYQQQPQEQPQHHPLRFPQPPPLPLPSQYSMNSHGSQNVERNSKLSVALLGLLNSKGIGA